jgi:GAF domain-containing protein
MWARTSTAALVSQRSRTAARRSSHPPRPRSSTAPTSSISVHVLIADVDLDHEYGYSGRRQYGYSGPRHYRAMLGVPVMVEDELIGIVVVMSSRPQI